MAWEHSRRLSKLIWWVAATNTAAAMVLALVRYQLPDASFWGLHPYWVFVAVVITVAVPLAQAAVVETGERRKRKRLEQEQKIQAFLAAFLVYLVEHCGTPWKNTGVQAFQLRGRWWWKRQDRIAKMRVGAIPTSGVKWSKGKGVIGRCWQTRQHQFHDLSVAFAPYASTTAEEWDKLPDDVRFGLTFADFQRLWGKYGIVAAVPIVRNDKYIGCVTADMPPLPSGQQRPNRDKLLESLATTAGLVAHVLAE